MTRDESFIPWSQIEPLVRPNMTAGELCLALLERLGLSPDRYTALTLRLVPHSPRESLRYGVQIVTKDEADRIATHLIADEVIA